MEKSERFGLVLTPTEKMALRHLAGQERISRAAVVRRLIWNEASRRGLLSGDIHQKARQQVAQGASGG